MSTASRFRLSSSLLLSCLVGVYVLVGNPSFSRAQWPTPKLTALHPPGGQAGTTVEVVVRGRDLDDLVALQFSHPGIVATAKRKPKTPFTEERIVRRQFTISIDGTVPSGEYEVWGVGRFGISNSKRFCIGPRPEMVESGAHASADAAIELPNNHTVNGHCDANARDYYRVPLAKNQRIVIFGQGQSIGSRALLTVELFDAEGNELKRVWNQRGGDPVVGFVALEAMELYVCVRDFLYRGGEEYFYRLHIHDGPHAVMAWPPVISRRAGQKVQLSGWNLLGDSASESPGDLESPILDFGRLETVAVDIDPGQLIGEGERSGDEQRLISPRLASLDLASFRWSHENRSSNPLRIYLSDDPLVIEDNEHQPQRVSLPVEYIGRFSDARDRDAVRFDARQGEVIWIEVLSERLGCTTDPELHVGQVLRDDRGNEEVKSLAVIDDPSDRNQRIGSDFDMSTDDPSYQLVVPADGEYEVQVRDLFYGSSDPRNFYRLRIGQRTPAFEAVVRPVLSRPPNGNAVVVSSLVLRRGQLARLGIMLDRRYGFSGSVEIVPTQLPDGVIHHPLVIPPGSASGVLTLVASHDAPQAQLDIELVAKGAINGQVVEQPVRFGSAVWGTPNRAQLRPEFRLTDRLPMSVLDFESHPVTILPGWNDEHPNLREEKPGQAIETRAFVTSRGGTLEIPLRLERRSEFADGLKLNPVGLPGEFGLQPIDVAGDADSVNVVLNATNANLKPGHYQLMLQTDTKWKYQRNPAAVVAAQKAQQRLTALIDKFSKRLEVEKGEVAGLKSDEDANPDEFAAAQTKLKQTEEHFRLLQQLKSEADQALQEVTNANKEIDLVETVQSWPIDVRIVDSPIRLSVDSSGDGLEARTGSTVELPLSLERDFGFSGEVELAVKLPEPLHQAEVDKVTVAEDQTTGRLLLSLPKDSPTGEFTITIQGTAKFNNVDVIATHSLLLNIEPKSNDPL